MSADLLLQRLWYPPTRQWGALYLWWMLLLPFTALFCVVSWLRRMLFRVGALQVQRVTKPVIVIGNLTVGGTGKTPLTIWLAQQLQARGLRVGIITRGYGGKANTWPQRVTGNSDPQQVGDEAVLLATESNAIVCVGADRVAAAKMAIAAGAELILSDDGLQHYRLHRDLECVVIDGARGLGNGWRLPAGPLRESVHRLRSVQAVLVNDRHAATTLNPLTEYALSPNTLMAHYSLRLIGVQAVAANEVQSERQPLSMFAGKSVHVVTGIGHPDAFVSVLKSAGIQPICHLLPDHAALSLQDITFADELPVIMTSKDAVKCRAFAGPRHWQAVAEVHMAAADAAGLLALVQRVASRST